MKSDEIKAEIKKVEQQIADLQRKNYALCEQLRQALLAESGLEIGEIVDVVSSSGKFLEKGLFGGYSTQYGRSEPIVWKLKKDGTASKFKVWMLYGNTIRKSE